MISDAIIVVLITGACVVIEPKQEQKKWNKSQ